MQAAGAIGMVVADNAPGDVTGLGGDDETIMIPSVRISQQAGVNLKAALTRRSRTTSGVIASLGVNPARLAGTDAANRIRMYTPTEFSPGSTVSHYTTDAKQNQLMEPSINGDLTHAGDGAERPDVSAAEGYRLVMQAAADNSKKGRIAQSVRRLFSVRRLSRVPAEAAAHAEPATTWLRFLAAP